MGTGSGAGVGTGKGVKGGWRVSAFLLLLTGWQAVLLPWSPLILKDAGFSATSVGLLSGGITLAASVGVVACLRAMRRSRSGAVRRLLLWFLFAGATLLQGCGVVLLLQYIPHTGLLQSCGSGWPFAPKTAVFPLNMYTPSTVSPQRPQSLTPKTNTTTTTTTTTSSTSIDSTLIPSTSTSTTTTTSTSTTMPPVRLPSNPPSTTTTTTVTPPTTAHAFIVPTAAATITSRPSHITVPTVQTTQTPNDKVPVNSSATTVESLTSGYPEGGEREHPEGAEEETIGTGGAAVKAPHTPPVTKGKLKAAHKNKGKSSHKNVSPDDSGQDKLYHMTTKHRNKSSQDNDQLTSQENDTDDTSSQDLVENDSSEEDEDETDEVDYEDTPPKHLNSYPRLGGKSSPLSSGFQHDVRVSGAATPWKPQPRRPLNRYETALHDHPNTDIFFSKKINPNEEFASLLSDQANTRLRLNPSPPAHRLLPQLKKTRRPHYPARPPHPAFASRGETHMVEDLPGGDWQYDDRGGQVRSRHTKYRRSRRNTHHTDSGNHSSAATADKNETLPQQNKTLDSKWNPVEGMENTGLKAAVAVLLALGGLLGAGVEASVAQLWHCYVHGYDEGGVSQDVLQRTITHTFHLSTYGSHKSWTGITSGGWVMAAGVVSILACLAGTGGSGYGGLLGMHLALGLASLLVLLVLPVPYGSVDPPRTRRPLSLYLDDEVLREGVRRLTFHLWVFVNGCLAALSLTFSLWLLQEMTAEGWLMGSQAAAVGVTLVCESLALHTQRRLVTRWGLHGLMGVCGVSLMLHYGVMWASESVGVVVAAHAGLGVAMAFLWVSVKHNALLLATVSDQEREAWASWWCWRFGMGVGAAVWSVGVSGAGGRVRPLLLLAALIAAILASVLCVTAVLSRRHSRTRRRVYHTLDLDMADEEEDVEEDAAENDWLVKRAKKEGLTL